MIKKKLPLSRKTGMKQPLVALVFLFAPLGPICIEDALILWPRLQRYQMNFFPSKNLLSGITKEKHKH